MSEIKQNRWESKVLWASVIAQVVVLGQLTGLFAAIGVDAGWVQDVLTAILQMAVIIGIINNPTDARDW